MDQELFEALVTDTIKKKPQWMAPTIIAMQRGIAEALSEAKRQRSDLETIAFMALHDKLFDDNKKYIASLMKNLPTESLSISPKSISDLIEKLEKD